MTYKHTMPRPVGCGHGHYSSEGLPYQTLFSVLAAIKELPQTALINAVNLLADRTIG